ncbi:MAG: lipocalin family protein [Flavobacteriaceae bacterium]
MNNRIKNIRFIAFVVVVMLGLHSCESIPEKAEPVTNFDVNQYTGLWYEIARIDFKHERNMDNVTAHYSLNEDGSIKVFNSGYNYVKEQWEKAEGKARFRGATDVAAMEVSFFGPFYGGYNVIGLDQEYQYALVAGQDLDYLWILSRTKTIPETVKENYLKIAQEAGYDTNRLIWVSQNRTDSPFLHEK